MKKRKSIFRKPFNILCNLLILLAPLAISNTASILFWGEPECPNSLKESISNK
ncbi:AgrD family cyclic lactone autoinducer peptide [Anaerosalibacter massiliensis]|uniref:Cyclic lactone autoinducer peptide n=1 Tax=Anaerosalibacter massiliensis TaxID=1347392 RepID=A0A9X2MJC3_9FIRM|nr:cyclic lactone autoinducer peptide [Anaerosalibacter massiliensis]MCR2044588.1 cyclic lactone autoinducer peptide [Anaerosalibacter massiliensis]